MQSAWPARKLRYDGLESAEWGKRMFCVLRKKSQAAAAVVEDLLPDSDPAPSKALRAIGWTSVAVGVTALGLFIGRELRIRYKFKRRTPSDFFSHAGEELDPGFGMGI